MPAIRNTALSSTLLAGRGAGRGGCSSAVVIGRTMSGFLPIAATTSRAKPYQLVARLVGDVMDAAAAVDGDPAQHRREVGA